MVENASLQHTHIIEGLNIHYGIQAIDLIPLFLGADMDALLYKVQTYDQLFYFLKLKRDEPKDKTAFILTFLSEQGIQNIIPPVQTLHGETSLYFNGFRLTLFPFIKGWDGFTRDLKDHQWFALGKITRQIHEIKVSRLVQSNIRYESYDSKWRNVLQSLLSSFESNMNRDEISGLLQEFMRSRLMILHRLVDRSEHLAQAAQKQSEDYVLCHSDLHGGNVLVDENDTLYIVDWDNPILAPKERDLMFIGGGVGNVWNKFPEQALFYKGYGKGVVNPILLAYYRYERIVEDLAIYGQKLLLTTEGGQGRVQWYHEFISQFHPQGVVEIAFKTDQGFKN